jgi:hypothetical protein
VIARLGEFSRANRVRRNHALEHATITVVTERHPKVFLSGRSNSRGFYIFGDIDTTELRSAAEEALARLKGGEIGLAIHPRCGTNLAVAGLLSGLAAAAAAQARPRQNRFAYSVLASLAALLIAPQLGEETQRHITTLAELGDLRIQSIQRRSIPLMRGVTHWVSTST